MPTLPGDTSLLIPRLVCSRPAAELEFCRDVFGAVVLNERYAPDGTLAHALLTIHAQMLMIEAVWPMLPSRAPQPDGSSPVVLFVYVEELEHTLLSATTRGATILVPAANQFWGDRTAWIMDPNGHVWTVAARVEQTTAEERAERWSHLIDRDTTQP